MKKYYIILLLLITSKFVQGQFGDQRLISYPCDGAADVFAVDLDGDGDLEVISAGVTDDKIAWYDNLGGGKYGYPKVISTNITSPRSIYSEDLDGDGNQDILVAGDSGLFWYKNLGGSLFGIEQYLSTDSERAVLAVDVDGDGDIDVISASFVNSRLAWYENLGGGVFNTQQIISSIAYNVFDVIASDLDLDGDSDLVSVTDSAIVWFENMGGGVIDTTQKIISKNVIGASIVRTADFDLDGDMDVVSRSNGKISWYENLGGGIIDTAQNILATSSVGYGLDVIDMDSDGDMDVICSSYSTAPFSGSIYWFENYGGGVFDTLYQSLDNTGAFSITSIAVADMDGDGDNEVLSTSNGKDEVAVYDNLGAGNFGPKDPVTFVPDRTTSTNSSDIDGDGDMDILSTSEWLKVAVWFENLGGGNFAPWKLITNNFGDIQHAFTSDINGDGKEDVVVSSFTHNKVAWFQNMGGGIIDTTQLLITDSAYGATFAAAADFDNDGDMDIVSGSGLDNKIAWYENLGSGIFGFQRVLSLAAGSASDVHAADMNNDGDIDIVAVHGNVVWFENQGAGVFSPQQIISTQISFGRSGSINDLDNDGLLDVLSASWNDDKIAWYRNLGGGNFGPQQIIINSDYRPHFVSGSDVDGDGDIDVLTAAGTTLNNSKLSWHENFGNGVFGPQQIITTNAYEPRTILPSDIDGDGDMDLISASYSDDKIAWYENHFNSTYQLKGKIYYDINQNTILDSGDIVLPFLQTQLQPTSLASFTSNSGDYIFATDSGTYTVSHAVDSLWALTTDSLTYTRLLNSITPVIDSLDFGFYPDTILTVINPSLTGGFPRCNTTINYWISIQNRGTTLPNGIIILQLNDSINFVSADAIPDSIIGQNIYWYYDSLFFYSQEMINVQVIMPPFTSVGDTLSSILSVNELDSLGNVVYVNMDTLDQEIVCAFDPNDKSVNPIGFDSFGYISQNQELEYLIRFQNTGNDTAITVIIKDTLDTNLDWSTLEPIASSHSVSVQIKQNGEAEFSFQYIMLPDSGADFLGSQGFIKYTIELKPGLMPNTSINNTANIYFDNNPAVITNTVLNTIECYGTPQVIINFNFPYLESSVIGNFTYQWYLNDTIIVGATTDTLLPLGSGNYNVEVTDTNGCSKLSQLYLHTITNITEQEQIISVVFPNPFNESTAILFEKNLNSNYNLLVYDIVGREVKRVNEISGNKVVINKKDIGEGLFLIYLINHKTGDNIFIGKLVAQ